MIGLVPFSDLGISCGKIDNVLIADVVRSIMVRCFGACVQMRKAMASLRQQKARAQREREYGGWNSGVETAMHGS